MCISLYTTVVHDTAQKNQIILHPNTQTIITLLMLSIWRQVNLDDYKCKLSTKQKSRVYPQLHYLPGQLWTSQEANAEPSHRAPENDDIHMLLRIYLKSRVLCTKVLSQSFFTPSDRSRQARQTCDVSFFLIMQHRESYKPSKNGAICASAYLLCAQRFYLSPVFDRTIMQPSIAPCIVDRSGTKVLFANFYKFNVTVCTKVLSATTAPLCTIIFGRRDPMSQCTKVLSRAAQGHKVLSANMGLYCAMFDMHQECSHNCHSFFKIATLKIHNWKQL